MRKLFLTIVPAIALLGLTGCGDGDENPAQSSQPAAQTTQQQPTGTPATTGTDSSATEAVQTRPSSSTGGPAPGGATGD